MLVGSSGSACNLLQFSNPSIFKRGSRLIFEGRVTKLFSLKSKSSSEDKKPRLSRVAPSDILQALRLRVFKELKLDKGDNTKLLKFELLLGNHHEVDGGGPLHLSKDNISRFLNKEKEEGSTLIAVPSAQNSFNISKFPKFSGNSSNFEQPERINTSRHFKSQMQLGRLFSILQFFKLKKLSLFKSPSDG